MLGGGGLVRAYSHSASITVDAAQIMHMCECYNIKLNFNYNLYGKVSYILPEFKVKQLNSDFGDSISMELVVKKELAEPLIKELTEITNARISIEKSNELFEDFS
jgi:putative IMPACT (imprinted ancient) family translation regulator